MQNKSKPLTLIIFGITSNLSQIKLLPALYDLAEKNLLPKDISIVGNARKPMTKEEIRKFVYEALHKENVHHKHQIKNDIFEDLLKKIYYIDGNLDDANFYPKLKQFLNSFSKKGQSTDNRIYYLATYPNLYHYIFEGLKENDLNFSKKGFVRLMIEKPIGNDLRSAKKLNSLLEKYFSNEQIYRLDHYLGKETIQNILTFRFGNDILEPLMNNQYIDHIQISALENFGIGKRGGYYDTVGALKDVGRNHQLQMLAVATMNAPAVFSNEEITKERVKILKNLSPFPNKLVLGQYEGYQSEENVSKDSQTDTFYALKTEIKDKRFEGVPIYIRAGKKIGIPTPEIAEIVVVFKKPINRLFKKLNCSDEPNILIYRIQPNEGIVLKILTKKPGHELNLEPEFMQFCYKLDPHSHYIPGPYEKLISDAIRGDQTFFNDAEEIEAQWAFIDPLVKKHVKPIIYKSGSWGPKEADKLIGQDGRKWIEPSMDFCMF